MIKKNQVVIVKVKSTITKIKILLAWLSSSFELREERINELTYRLIDIMQSDWKKRMEKTEQPQKNMEHTCVMKVTNEKSKRSRKNIWSNHSCTLLKFDETY